MAYASAPVILDSTGQNIATSLATLATNIAAMKGATGTAGVGVASFVWYSNSGGDPQGTAGTIDTYRMTFTDGNHVDVSVYNGVNGLGALVWGNITGTLSDQADLRNALNAKADNAVSVSVTIATSDWALNTCNKSVTGVTPLSNIIITPDPTDFIAYSSAQIRATAQGNGTVTFQCETVPNEAITVNVLLVWNPKYATESGSIVSFNALRSAPLSSLAVDINPVQSGSGTPAYDNVRPISGWSEAKVTRCGKNLLGINRAEGTPSPTDVLVSPRLLATDKLYAGLRADNYYYRGYITNYSVTDSTIKVTSTNNFNYGVAFPVACHGGMTYTLSATLTGCNMSVGCYDANWNFIQRLKSVSSNTLVTFTTPADAAYITVVFGSSTLGTEGTATNIQLELGSSATSYEAYQSNTYTIDLDGTRYGGSLDVLSGVLTLTHGYIASYNSEVLPSTWISDRDVYAVGTTPTTGAEVVYELATPTTVQLTAQQVETLFGQNYIWADTGETTVTYISN